MFRYPSAYVLIILYICRADHHLGTALSSTRRRLPVTWRHRSTRCSYRHCCSPPPFSCRSGTSSVSRSTSMPPILAQSAQRTCSSDMRF
jgi:hypothetical protein